MKTEKPKIDEQRHSAMKLLQKFLKGSLGLYESLIQKKC